MILQDYFSMSDDIVVMEDGEKHGLPAFQRSRQITDIFTNVENILPSMDFSDNETEDDDDLESVSIDHESCNRTLLLS